MDAPVPRKPFWNRKRVLIYAALLLAAGAVYVFRGPIRYMVMNRTFEMPRTVSQVLSDYGDAVRQEFEPICEAKGVQWPPARMQMLAFKEERMLELWAANLDGPFQKIAGFPILGMSGTSGPKRRSGDLQVPEGFYRLTHLNPQSSFHLSIRVDYPNEEDIANAAVERNLMGGDIYIHGREASVGCLAMGDAAIEKIFCLTAQAQPEHRNIIISPVDFRTVATAPDVEEEWVRDLYGRIEAELGNYRK